MNDDPHPIENAGEPENLEFSDVRLARLYDATNTSSHDFDFYEQRIGESPKRVADIGCGTGIFAARLTAKGHAVVGVDPSPAMLTVARERPGTELVTWIEGTAGDLPSEPAFDYATMMGHAFQCLLTDADIAETLVAVRRRLKPGGAFMFETRNPLARAWLRWNPEESRGIEQVDGIGEVDAYNEVVAVESEIVTFDSHIHFLACDTKLLSRERLRFIRQPELAVLLASAGYDEVEWIGDWDGAPFDEATSREIIVIARSPHHPSN